MLLEENQLKRFIVGSGLVSNKDMADAEEEAEEKQASIGEILVSRGKLTADDLRRMQARASGLPFIDLRAVELDFGAMRSIPEPISRKHNVVAFRKTPVAIEVAMLDLGDKEAVDFLQKRTGLKIAPHLTDVDSMRSALLRYQKDLKREFEGLFKVGISAATTVDILLKQAAVQHASDIHIEPQENELLVRHRIDGILHDAMVLPKASWPLALSRIKGLAGLKVAENRFPQEGRFSAELSGERLSLRVSTVPTVMGEKVFISLAKDDPAGAPLDRLGFHGENLERAREGLRARSGLMLVTGPRTSGVSTTLYSLVGVLNTPKVAVSTIEDKIERRISRASQMQTRPDIGLSFAEGMRSILRQDSDVIMVGDIPDGETAALAAAAALSGKLVLAGMRAASAASAIVRLGELKIDPLLAGSTVSHAIGQRLARKLAPGSGRKPLSRAELGALGKVVDLDKMLGLLRTERIIGQKDGWSHAEFGTPSMPGAAGYEGLLGIQEVLRVTPTIRALIMKGASAAEIEARAKKEGMITMLEDGILKAAQGLTTIEEVLRVISQ